MKTDDELKAIMQQGWQDIRLSEDRKDDLHRLLTRELAREQPSWLSAITSKLASFWDTTFEIPLAPAVTAISLVAVVFFGSLFYPGPGRSQGDSAEVRYIRQVRTDSSGQIQVAYLPIDKER